MKFKKGDEVLVTAGKDRGKRGKIEKVFPKERTALVTGVNIYKRHLKPRGQDKPGGIIDITKPLNVGKIALVCPKCGKPTRVGYQLGGESSKVRICLKCKGVI
ncbi:MAG: large subunit ribosomal protein L24 [Microgenomates group bacterium LiPW_16]|nr:MAG: large subunit ribosomal protein L24 [Microgenomates group bacterium LiPW_16]